MIVWCTLCVSVLVYSLILLEDRSDIYEIATLLSILMLCLTFPTGFLVLGIFYLLELCCELPLPESVWSIVFVWTFFFVVGFGQLYCLIQISKKFNRTQGKFDAQ